LAHPQWADLDDNLAIFLKFDSVPPLLKRKVFSATFLRAQHILDGKASHALDRGYVWGF
jgi:hypothetical protein